MLIRPERLSFAPEREATGALVGAVYQAVYLGTDIQYGVRLDGGPDILVRSQNAGVDVAPFQSGDRVGLAIAPGAARLLVD